MKKFALVAVMGFLAATVSQADIKRCNKQRFIEIVNPKGVVVQVTSIRCNDLSKRAIKPSVLQKYRLKYPLTKDRPVIPSPPIILEEDCNPGCGWCDGTGCFATFEACDAGGNYCGFY